MTARPRALIVPFTSFEVPLLIVHHIGVFATWMGSSVRLGHARFPLQKSYPPSCEQSNCPHHHLRSQNFLCLPSVLKESWTLLGQAGHMPLSGNKRNEMGNWHGELALVSWTLLGQAGHMPLFGELALASSGGDNSLCLPTATIVTHLQQRWHRRVMNWTIRSG